MPESTPACRRSNRGWRAALGTYPIGCPCYTIQTVAQGARNVPHTSVGQSSGPAPGFYWYSQVAGNVHPDRWMITLEAQWPASTHLSMSSFFISCDRKPPTKASPAPDAMRCDVMWFLGVSRQTAVDFQDNERHGKKRG